MLPPLPTQESIATRVEVMIAPEENPSRIKQIMMNENDVSCVQVLVPIIDNAAIKDVTMINLRYSPVRAIQKPEDRDPIDIAVTLGKKKRPA